MDKEQPPPYELLSLKEFLETTQLSPLDSDSEITIKHYRQKKIKELDFSDLIKQIRQRITPSAIKEFLDHNMASRRLLIPIHNKKGKLLNLPHDVICRLCKEYNDAYPTDMHLEPGHQNHVHLILNDDYLLQNNC